MPRYIMLRTSFLIILALQLSCTPRNGIVGTWTANKYSTWEQGIAYLKGSRAMLTGKEIILKPDFTFQEAYNGMVRSGNWHVLNDTLYLIGNYSNIQSYDTVDISGDVVHLEIAQESFAIKKSKLIKYHSGNYCKRMKTDSTNTFKNNFLVEILKKE